MKKFMLIAAMLIGNTALAGEGSLNVKCVSATGRTNVSVFMSDGGSSAIELSVKDAKTGVVSKSIYVNEFQLENSRLNGNEPEAGTKVVAISSIEKSHVLAYLAADQGANKFVELVSTLGSIKVVKGQYNSKAGPFNATLTAFDPRPNHSETLSVDVKCSYDYSI